MTLLLKAYKHLQYDLNHDCFADNGVTGSGPSHCDVMGIGIAPSRTEWEKTREPFTGPAGQLLRGTITATKADISNIFLTNVHCQWNDTPTPEEIAQCWPRLQQEIEHVNPCFIVLFGEIVKDWFQPILGIKKMKRGHLYYQDGRWYMYTYHPAAFTYKHVKLDIADFARDIGKIKTCQNWRDKKPPEYEYEVFETAEKASDFLWSLKGLNVIDIESSYDGKTFVYPDNGMLVGNEDSKLLCFSIANPTDGIKVIPGWLIKGLRKGWGARPEVDWAGHLVSFDANKLWLLLDEELTIKEDSLLQSYSLDERGAANEEDERAVGPHGLKLLSSEFLGCEEYNINVLQAKADEAHKYNAYDVGNTLGLINYFTPLQIEDNVRHMYESILIPGVKVLSESQAYGCHVNLEALYALGAKWSARWLELHALLQDEALELGWDRKEAINLGSWQQLSHLLFDVIKHKPHPFFGFSTKKEVMLDFAEDVPWCKTLLEWRALDHMLNAYVVGIEDDIKYDGRLHPEPVLHGTRSGRLSYHKPPIQTIPKHGVDEELAVIRSLFDATSNDYVIIEADLRQAELWATAYLSGDETFLASLVSGDAHGATARDMFNTDETNPQWKLLRELGKMFNFGTLYNRQAKSYSENMWQGRRAPKGLENVHWTKRQAQVFIDNWFEKRPKVKEWQKEEQRKAFREGEQQTITGRKRRYWLTNYKTVNQAVNIGPQSVAHDFLFDSFRKLHYLLAEFDAHVLFEVHDSLLIEANKKWLPQTMQLIQHVMTEPKFNLGGIPCDIAVGANWHEVKKVSEEAIAAGYSI